MALFIALETAGWPVEVAALQSNDVITGPGSVQDRPPHTYCTNTLQRTFMLDSNLCFSLDGFKSDNVHCPRKNV